MTDEELLQLVETKSPGELSLDEIQTLRKRLAESDELQTAFSSRLRLQTFLAEVLARIDLAPDDVLRENSHQPAARGGGGRWKWGAALLLVVAVSAVFFVPQLREPLRLAVHQLTGDESAARLTNKSTDPAETQPDRSPKTEDDSATDPAQDPKTETPAVESPGPGSPASASPAGESPNPPSNTESANSEPGTTGAENPRPAQDLAGEDSEPKMPPPWQAAMLAEPVHALESLLFQRFDTRKVLPQAADLHRWFDVIVGEPNGIVEARSKYGQCGAIEGILRFNAPWTDDSLLRLQLESYKQLQIHLFAGNRGVTLVFLADQPERWAAYATTRKPGGFTPQTWQLTATDGGRNLRTGINQGGPYQLRHRRGELLLTRGDIVLVSAPLPELPEDVYFQGQASIVGLDWQRVRAADVVADAAPNALPAAAIPRSVRAASFAWQSHLEPQATFSRLPDQAIRLESEQAVKRSWTTIWRPRDELQFIDLELDQASAGAGIYLGDIANPKWVLRYVRDNRTGQLCLLARGNDDLRTQQFGPLNVALLPSVAGRHWVRLVFGPSMIRWWLSMDGEHWAEADPLRNVPANLTRLGLHCATGPKCGVTLRQIRLTPLTAITSRADPKLRRQMFFAGEPNTPQAPQDVAAWSARITEFQPPGCTAIAWRRACAVQTLAAGCTAALGNSLLDLLLDDAEQDGLPLEQQLQLLDQAALLADLIDNQQRVQAWVDRYHRLGMLEATRNGGAAFSSIRAALMSSSIKTIRTFEISYPPAIGEELVQRVYAGDWPATSQFCRQIRFFHLQAKVPLFEWSEMAAAKRTPEGLSDELLTRLPETWRNLLIEHQSKEVYNVAAELAALLASEAFEDAAQMMATIDPRALPGVAVDARDDRLLASLPAMMKMAAQRHPQLRAAVSQRQAALADLRLREYISRHDAAAVAQVALQFPGTPAVFAAHAWLGDRALSSGWFETALRHYRLAAGAAGPINGTDVDSRLSLARVMLGGSLQADTPPPKLGDIQIKIEEVKAIQASRNAEVSSTTTRYAANGFVGAHKATVAPTGFAVHKRARLDGSVGQEPNRVLNGNINVFKIDWANRQLAVALDATRLYISNRFQVAAYDRKTGARVWQSPQLPGRVRRAHEWSLTAMRPVLHGQRIYARQLYGDTTSLVCLEKEKGQPVWIAEHRQNIDVISDPMVIQDRLVCLTMVRTSQLESVVRFTALDPETGTIWEEHDLVTLSNAWQRRQVCEVQPIQDGMVAVLGGVVLSCDASGQLRWVSRQVLLPPDEQPDWVTQVFAPPLVWSDATRTTVANADRIFVTEPGVRALQCLDAETGERVWSLTLPDLRRLLGISAGCLIAQGKDRLLGLDPATGGTRWQRPIEPLLHGYLCDGEHGILVARRHPIDEKKSNFVPELVWLDGQNGQETHATRLAGLEDADPRLGPMFVSDGQLWTLFGKGPNDANRDLIQLEPSAKGALVSIPPAAKDPWQQHLESELHRALSGRFPDWGLLRGIQAKGTGVVPDFHGQKEVLALAARSGVPLALGRSLDVPMGSRPRLRLKFGSEVNRPGQIEVRFQGITVAQIEITPKSHPQPWKTIDVDLQDFAGETGWLTVQATFVNGNSPVLLAWQQLDVVF